MLKRFLNTIKVSNNYIEVNNINIDSLRIVISFSLYGNVRKYVGGLLENCKNINKIYPNFWIYVYLGNDFDRSIMVGRFNDIKNLVFIETGKSGDEVACYRFFAIDREEVGISFSRDCDSRINNRDQYCINEFLKSDKKFQIIRYHPEHKIGILAGMWGIKKGILNFKIEGKLIKFKLSNRLDFGSDQDFLKKYIYDKVKKNSLIFDEYFNYAEETPLKIESGYEELYGEKQHVGYQHMPVNLDDPFGNHGKWYPL
jgi:hypothetical protein